MLEHVRVLDLSDERGLLCGRLLADLGADVVQVEPAGGSTARAHPPLSGGRSFYWDAYAANKRGVSADLDSPDVPATLADLFAAADILITSQPPGRLRAQGLEPERVVRAFPHLVHTAITPFGLTGPKSDRPDSDLVLWAAGGPLDPHREDGRPPVRISVPQAYLHAAADAAGGALLAHLARRRTGRGQVVDVSVQACLGLTTLGRALAHAVGDESPEWQRVPTARTDQSGSGAATTSAMKKWRCRDGVIEFHLAMGPASGGFTNNFFAWLNERGACDPRFAAWDWRLVPGRIESGEITPDDIAAARADVSAFFAGTTKAEVLDAALEHRLLCVGIADMADIAASPQLAFRDYWSEVGEGPRATTLPGCFAQVSGSPFPNVRRSAPLPGEHDAEVRAEWTAPAEPGAGAGAPAPRHRDREPRPGPPLAGLRVLDLSWVVAGPLIGRALADFGAEVVRVESTRRIETSRFMPPFYRGVPGPENSALFGNSNAGKYGLSLDLGTEEGREVALDLIARSDIVIEAFSPGRMARWGLAPRDLLDHDPRLIVVSSSLMGQTGPHAGLAGFGSTGASLSGFQNLVGRPDDLPFGTFGPYTDYVGPRLALVAVLGALEQRERSGRGCVLDVSQVESGIYFLSPYCAQYAADGTIARRRGNADEVFAPHGVYPCLAEGGRDRFVAVAVRDDAEWPRLARAVGRTDLAADPDLADAAGRRARQAELDAALSAWTGMRKADEAEALLLAAGIAAHVSASSADLADDPALRHRGHFVRLPHPLHGEAVVEGPRALLSDTPGVVRRAAPVLGQDNEYVLRELLGYSARRIERLTERKVLT
ncbi:CaiB/BaiF CoA-transferase family protein [Streptomyces spongiae]|uniref:CoA transferase n=1 Tax=Streptomyces spongiae TaxID=565072 RepID=A0A5N8XAL0_9ACTN|nr:CoA transferase [Streptomyces spongiae]MPY56513.1 CoA transferase [Streptomyces spongiae]